MSAKSKSREGREALERWQEATRQLPVEVVQEICDQVALDLLKQMKPYKKMKPSRESSQDAMDPTGKGES